ncbi:inositol polyphosphate 1-phosphatase [Hylaeus anthracinus]|uniref:inositol polyphosphate 1-phosphatase n=1 Tax=Hylaeus volcanicus TaxID=313075 RepID=UPI0023B7F270|nr:inositol polyphosphate 1-phosphatase [Hylaeus volcanicus]XP_053981959.1 inositol polyphosphate 1-phosphatase [Hylaeus volcanicus]XP_053998267.1 inositol polyphosphate 1-phosphatase [Hylaeus anthracinus]
MKDGSRLLSILLKVSEKAANIARACRQNDALFKLLVQEKSEEEKNPRFFQDFKTLADVLIQETIRHDLEIEFPELAKVVQGEENNTFSNAMGESIVVEVCSTIEETTQLLAKVMGSDTATAELLATEVHKDVQFLDVPVAAELPLDFDINISDLGIWIDPIDSTADYINGGEKVDDVTGMHLSGLRCVTVLIGAYLKSTGIPVVGVVNQPFYTNENLSWKGNCYWGLVENDTGKCSINEEPNDKMIAVISRVEDVNIKSKLLNAGFTLVEATGAGYKILSVALGQADVYILSKSSTYKWDTCGPHALLRSLHGGIIEFQTFIDNSDLNYTDIKYISTTNNSSNSSGLIAYRKFESLQTLKSILCK